MEESKRLEDHVAQTSDIKINSIAEFQKAYEVYIHNYCTYVASSWNFADMLSVCATQEQSKSDAEKLIADISSLVSIHICRQKEMVCLC